MRGAINMFSENRKDHAFDKLGFDIIEAIKFLQAKKARTRDDLIAMNIYESVLKRMTEYQDQELEKLTKSMIERITKER